MSRIYSAVCAAAIALFAFTASAQTTVTASNLKMAGYKISSGTVTFTPVDKLGVPIAFADATGAQNGPTAFSCHITNGAIDGAIQPDGTVSGTCAIPDATQTTPANILYQIQVADKSSGLSTSGKAYVLQSVIGVSGATWALDHYGPPAQTTNIQAIVASHGTTLPGSCQGAAFWTHDTTHVVYTCVGGTFVATSPQLSGAVGTVQIVGSNGLPASSDKTTMLNSMPVAQLSDVGRKPLLNWLKSLHGGSTTTGITHLKIIGDSYSICANNHPCNVGPSVSTNRWVEQLRLYLQKNFGYGGTGIMPLQFSIGGLNINFDNYPATTGTLDNSNGSLGPSMVGAGGYALVHLSDGATITFKPGNEQGGMPYDHLFVYCMTNSTSGMLTAVIDGNASTPIAECNSTSASPTAHLGNVIGLGPTTHTAVVTSHGDTYIYAMEGTLGTSGVVVSNLGFGGSDTTTWGSNVAGQLAFSDLEVSGTQGTIICLGTNDLLHGVSPLTFQANLSNIVTHELAGYGSPSVGLFIPPVSSGASPGNAYTNAQYAAAQMAVYNAQPIDVLNMQWQTGTTYSSTSGLWFADAIHPNDRLSLMMAAMVEQRWVDHLPVVTNFASMFDYVVQYDRWDGAIDTETRIGHFTYLPNGGTIVATSGIAYAAVCATPPTLHIADCGVNGDSGVGSPGACTTDLTSLTLPTANNGTVQFNKNLSITIPAGHWIGGYIGVGSCTTPPSHMVINATIQTK